MATKEHKSKPVHHCPNCKQTLKTIDKFCPSCGQKNRDARIKLRDLLYDFFSGVFNLDSKTLKTLAAIWVPGKLTKLFFEGKRNSYTHPLRLYLFISFILFGIIGYDFNNSFNDSQISKSLDTTAGLQEKNDLISLDSLVNEIQSNSPNIDYGNGASALLYLYIKDNKDTLVLDTLQMELGKLTFDNGVDSLSEVMLDDSILRYYETETEAFIQLVEKAKLQLNEKTAPDSISSELFFLKKIMKKDIKIAKADMIEYDTKSLYEKYDIQGFFPKLYVSQASKIMKNPANALYYILSGFSWIALLFIPFMALWLSLIYIRKKSYYVEHLVFTVHSTSLLFLSIILIMLLRYITSSSLFYLLLLLYPLYLLYAIKRYYGQNWFKTIIKWVLGQNIGVLLLMSLSLLSLFIRMLIY